MRPYSMGLTGETMLVASTGRWAGPGVCALDIDRAESKRAVASVRRTTQEFMGRASRRIVCDRSGFEVAVQCGISPFSAFGFDSTVNVDRLECEERFGFAACL